MLTAILKGKKRGSGLAGRQLKLGDSEGAEDILTATVFERLSYLPDAVFAAIMNGILAGNDIEFGPIHSIEFWPSWELEGGRVEPDVVIYSAYTAIVEAKRLDGTEMQYGAQLARELRAAWAEGMDSRRCVLLTVGGLVEDGPTEIAGLRAAIVSALGKDVDADFILASVSWRTLFQIMERVIHQSDAVDPGAVRLLDDIAAAYDWHGIRTHPPRWLKDLSGTNINHLNIDHLAIRQCRFVTRPDTGQNRIFDKLAIRNPLMNLPAPGFVTKPGACNFLAKRR